MEEWAVEDTLIYQGVPFAWIGGITLMGEPRIVTPVSMPYYLKIVI